MICVQYLGSTQAQVMWGGNDDPENYLKKGVIYIVERIEPHSYHTKLYLLGFPGKKFNSTSFKRVEI